MGHLLSTVNPEAAAAIRPEPAPEITRPAQAPYVGQTVQYHARPGEGRSGKMVFPAMLIHYEPHSTCAELIVFYAADDIIDRVGVPYMSEDRPYPSWTFVPEQRIAPRLTTAMDHVFGEHAVDGSIMDRIVALEAEVAKRKGGRPRKVKE